MLRQPAKVLPPGGVRLLLKHVGRQRHAKRNKVLVLLSFKAGLRACEMSGLDWSMVTTSRGQIDDHIRISRHIAKMGSARQIPMHPELATALLALRRSLGDDAGPAVIRSTRGERLTAASIVNWFSATYRELELDGCSSHSGRRTFITQAARVLAKSGGSLRDIQELAGHRSITTTERYIEGDRECQRRLIRLL